VDREWWIPAVVDQERNAAVGIEAQEPFLLLLIGHNVNDSSGPCRAICLSEFFEKDLNCLTIRSALGDEMKAFGLLDVFGRLVNIKLVGHVEIL